MRIVICAFDKANSTDLRTETRPAHLEYLDSLKESTTVTLEVAVAMKNEEGTMIGSLLILDAPDLAAARELAANDPYSQAGLFADVRIHEAGTAVWPA